jgi:hypothetical protein
MGSRQGRAIAACQGAWLGRERDYMAQPDDFLLDGVK